MTDKRIQIIGGMITGGVKLKYSTVPRWLSGKFVENSIKLIFLEITDYRLKCSAVLRFIELQIRHGRKV
jgi:Na+-translocating ferredoxin:NAD+ oxidoreductase RnfA subunit